MFMNIIMAVTMYPVLLIVWAVYKFMDNTDNSIVLGVKIPFALSEEDYIEQAQKDFKKYSNISFWIMLFLPISFFFVKYASIAFNLWMIWLCFAIAGMGVLFAHFSQKIKKYKKEKGLEDEDDKHWIWGMFYYNSQNKKVMIEQRFGTGYTMNMATMPGKILTGIGIVAMLSLPVVGVRMVAEEFTPIHIFVDQGDIICKQIHQEYTIPISEIKEISYQEKMEKDVSKNNGTAFDNLEKGQFSVKGQGQCTLFVNPKEKGVLRIVTAKRVYFIGGYNEKETRQVYDEILQQQKE